MRLHRLASLPPGPYHDEAYNGLDAVALLEGREFPIFHDTWEIYADEIHARRPAWPTRWPVFLEGNYGREPLQVYLMALAFRFLGVSDWSLRVNSALGGILAICVAVPLARTLLAEEVRDRRHLRFIAVVVAAGLYPLLAFSRLGLRLIWFVVLEGIAVLAFWRAWRTNRLGTWALAGLALGMVQYTYGAARLLPVVLLAFLGIQIVGGRCTLRERLPGLLVMAMMTIVVVAPLGRFLLYYPEFLTLRTHVIAVDEPGSGWSFWVHNGLRMLQGLVWGGDPNPLLNLPGRPFLDPLQVLLAGVGLITTLRWIQRPVYCLLSLWLVVMLAPAILVGTAPHFGRSLGAAYPLVLLMVVGADRLWRFLSMRRFRVFAVGGVVVLMCSLLLTAYDYFVRYPGTPDLYHEFKAHLADLGRFARHLSPDATLYLTPPQKYYAGILFELGDESRIQDFYGPAGLLPAGVTGRPIVYLVLAEDDFTGPVLERNFPMGRWITRTADFAAFSVPTDAAPVPTIPLVAGFGDAIRLRGVDLSSFSPGRSLDVRLYWQAVATPPANYTAFVHLVGPDGRLVAQLDSPPGRGTYTTDRWLPGEMILDTYSISLPVVLDPGTYRLATGFYDDSITRLPTTQNGHGQLERVALLATLEVP